MVLIWQRGRSILRHKESSISVISMYTRIPVAPWNPGAPGHHMMSPDPRLGHGQGVTKPKRHLVTLKPQHTAQVLQHQ